MGLSFKLMTPSGLLYNGTYPTASVAIFVPGIQNVIGDAGKDPFSDILPSKLIFDSNCRLTGMG